METDPGFTRYMTSYYNFRGLWDSPSRCGLCVVKRNDNKVLVIVTELYRQNPGTPYGVRCIPGDPTDT